MKLSEHKSQMAILLAKIGVFFAKCDGNYDSKEKQFISNFIMELENTESLENELKELIENTVTSPISFKVGSINS